MSPIQSKGMLISSFQIGLKPLFLITFVQWESVATENTPLAFVEGGFVTPEPCVETGRNGELVHSGIWSETSTKGSTMDFSTIS